MNDSDPSPLICVVDDDADIRDSFETLLRSSGYKALCFACPRDFLSYNEIDRIACLILDIRLDHYNGLDLQRELVESNVTLPIILVSGHGDVPTTVRGMRAGALTFLTKPVDQEEMLTVLEEAVARDRIRRLRDHAHSDIRKRFDILTPRERDVLGLVAAGLMNKQIAGRLELSEVTVKIHRGNMMRKMAADSLADLVRMAETLGIRRDVGRYSRRQ